MMSLEDSAGLAITLGVVAGLLLYVWTALALSAVFSKSSEAGWKAWVPILNQVVLFRLGGQSPWLLLLYLVPGVGALAVWVVQIVACHRIGAAFGFGGGMTVLAALLLPVWASIIGFGSARWLRRRGEASAGVAREPAPIAETGADDVSWAPAAAPAAGGWTPVPSGDSGSRSETVDAAPAPAAPVEASTPVPVARSAAAAEASIPEVSVPVVSDADLDADLDDVTAAPTSAPTPVSALGRAKADPTEPLVASRPAAEPEPVAEPTAAVAAPAAAQPAPEPWAPPEPDAWAPRRSTAPVEEPFDANLAVSAVAGSPDAGAPRSARSSVSAQMRRPEIPEDPLDVTIVSRRKRTDWSLTLPSGETVPIGAHVVLLGRRPSADPDFPSAQLVAVDDPTVSKTHARLELKGDVWFVTDLESTNGVAFSTLLGTEVEAEPGEPTEAGDRFLLGDAEIRLMREHA
jgi:hypothetical protein